MSKQTAKDLALNYFNAWKNKDFDKVATLLSDDITFEMPINNYETKEAFLQTVEFTASEATDVKLLTAIGDEYEAMLIYNISLTGLSPLTICEHFRVRDRKIVFIRHVHDTHQLRIAGFDRS